MKPKTFENVFAPLIDKKFLNVEQIPLGLRVGVILHERLPPEAKGAVDAELARRRKNQMTRTMLLVMLLGTMGEVRHKTRLQRYMFLADKQIARQKGRRPVQLVCDWKLYKFGPFSPTLDLCVRDAIKSGTIEVFTAQKDGKDGGAGYRLTAKGRAKFSTMLQTLGATSRLIHGLLHKFQKGYMERQLLEFVHAAHPERATQGEMLGKLHMVKGPAWGCPAAILQPWLKSRLR